MTAFGLLLTGDDLARVRLMPVPDPLEEIMWAAHLLRLHRNDPILGGWSRRTVQALGAAGREVISVLDSDFFQYSDFGRSEKRVVRTFEDVIEHIRSAPPSSWITDLNWLGELGVGSELARGLADKQDGAINHLASALKTFHRAAIAPYWSQMQVAAAVGSDSVARLMAQGGVELLLRDLHPMITWDAPVLSLDLGAAHPPGCVHRRVNPAAPQTYALGGRGLLLVPSIFVPTPTLDLAGPDGDEPVVVTFPIRTDWYLSHEQFSIDRSPLANLLGATRAAVLEALSDQEETTSGLARRLKISVASASEHAAVLRATKLVISVRDGNRVIHNVSTLGQALARSLEFQSDAAPRQ